ncbi:MAG: transcriptional repressor LexA [Actinomycetaceae bacterium]|nr:transcriptional repressor LexA [Actinomycetaceae bacterium]
MTDANLTARQLQIFETVRTTIMERGIAPTVREIGDAVGLKSPSSVKHQLDILKEAGVLAADPRRPRTLEITDLGYTLDTTTGKFTQRRTRPARRKLAVTPEPDMVRLDDTDIPIGQTVNVPLVGRIAAGGPILAEQMIEDVFPLPRQLTGTGELFMLKVSGDSMIDAAICDGDWVVVRRQPVADNGQIVAAMIDDEATVKVFSRMQGHTWLLPRNSDYAPIPADNAVILGKVVTVLRAL